ncbi:hypothetical protein [Amnibacterium endophyticum]|uniref:Uncharacterized protein n=1 Tax=Amnibacterium endophyticum TaxID=2109337 RepID=A0ABW4LIG5_9MICO
MTMSQDEATRWTAEPAGMPVSVWALEDTLSAERRHLRVGAELHTLVRAADPPLRRLLTGVESSAEWIAPFDAPTAPCSFLRIRGRVQRIDAVALRFRQGSTGPEPVAGTARTWPVGSTCDPEPSRSVWPLSGQLVLVGFLLALDHPDLDRRLG